MNAVFYQHQVVLLVMEPAFRKESGLPPWPEGWKVPSVLVPSLGTGLLCRLSACNKPRTALIMIPLLHHMWHGRDAIWDTDSRKYTVGMVLNRWMAVGRRSLLHLHPNHCATTGNGIVQWSHQDYSVTPWVIRGSLCDTMWHCVALYGLMTKWWEGMSIGRSVETFDRVLTLLATSDHAALRYGSCSLKYIMSCAFESCIYPRGVIPKCRATCFGWLIYGWVRSMRVLTSCL